MRRAPILAIAAAVALAFSVPAVAQAMTKSEYKAGKESIKAEAKATKKTACDPLAGNAKDICAAQADGKERMALADLETRYKPSAKARYDARVAKADAEYAVAKERCDDAAGNMKDVCVKEAKAAHVSAKADAKVQEKIVDARKDAAADKRDAEYAVAKEKCEGLAGATKEACVKDAKVLYGKT
jgi:hypothetical protein